MSGFIASSLIGVIYATPMRAALERLLRTLGLRVLKYEVLGLSLSILLLMVAESILLQPLMRMATALFVVASITTSSSLALNILEYIRAKRIA